MPSFDVPQLGLFQRDTVARLGSTGAGFGYVQGAKRPSGRLCRGRHKSPRMEETCGGSSTCRQRR